MACGYLFSGEKMRDMGFDDPLSFRHPNDQPDRFSPQPWRGMHLIKEVPLAAAAHERRQVSALPGGHATCSV